ncbi:MAG TPA: SRPBCC family protein [Kaistia sp.]|nr:SRPBCC family protein [Kaistia sp.]
MSSFSPRSVSYTAYIATTPAEAWRAITDPDRMALYFGGRRIQSGFEQGDEMRVFMRGGVLDVLGEVIAVETERLLSLTWHVEWHEEMRKLPPSLLTFRIEPSGEMVKFTVEHGEYQEPLPDASLEDSRNGWPMIVSSLKTLLETGRPLPIQFAVIAVALSS